MTLLTTVFRYLQGVIYLEYLVKGKAAIKIEYIDFVGQFDTEEKSPHLAKNFIYHGNRISVVAFLRQSDT